MQGTSGLTFIVLAVIVYEGKTQKPTKVPWVAKERDAECICRDRQNPVCGDNGVTYPSMVCYRMCAPAGVKVVYQYPCWVTEEEILPVNVEDVEFEEGDIPLSKRFQDGNSIKLEAEDPLRPAIIEYRILREFHPDSDKSTRPKQGLRIREFNEEANMNEQHNLKSIDNQDIKGPLKLVEQQNYISKDRNVDLDDEPEKNNKSSNSSALDVIEFISKYGNVDLDDDPSVIQQNKPKSRDDDHSDWLKN